MKFKDLIMYDVRFMQVVRILKWEISLFTENILLTDPDTSLPGRGETLLFLRFRAVTN